ncbi:MAG: hypothetical protein Q8R13_00805, partial [bacterium]|nr:hypothetical protein [bacterium]
MAASEYITLKEAAASTPYSQEYLSLRARQGRLKAIKKNDVWYTTRAWLEEYWRGVSGGDTGPIAGSEASRSLVPYQSLAPARSIRSLVRAAGRSPVVHGVLVGILFVSGALAAPESWSRAAGDAAGMFFENVGRGTAVVLTAIPGTSRYGLAAAVAETIEGQAQQARTFFREIGEGFAVLLGRGRNALGRVLLGRRVFQEPEFTRGVFGPERKDVRQEQKGIVQVGEALAVTPAVPAPSVIVREVTTTIREVPTADSSLLAGLTATREELARTQQNFVLLRSDLNQDVAFLKNEIEALKAQAALPLSVSPALQQVIYQTVVQTATPPGASLGGKEITAALESGAIAPTSMRVGSMTLNGVTLAGLATIDSSPAITGILTISGTGTSTVASSLQVASYLTAGNLLTVPYFTATSTTATSTIATGGFTVGANQFVVQQASGNVGIGTTSPGSLLGLQGIGNFGETRSTLYSALTLSSLAATSTTATSTFAGRTVFTSVPTLAHAFSSWAIGVSGGNALDAPLIVNPSSAAADTNLIGVAVNDAVRFLVDAEGDVFANSLTSVGAQTLSSTTASTLFVENNTTLGDGITDLFTINGGTVIYNNVATTTLVNSRVNAFAIGTSTTEVPLLTFDTLNSRLGLLTVAPTNRFDVGGGQFVVSAGGNVGLGTTSPGSLLAL